MSFVKAEGRMAMVRLKGGDALLAAVRALLATEAGEEEDRAILRGALDNGDITVVELRAMMRLRKVAHKRDQAADDDESKALLPLRSLLQGVAWPVDPVPEDNPEQVKRREWLLARQGARDYASKISNLPRQGIMSLQQSNELQRQSRLRQKRGFSPVSEARNIMREISVGLAMILVCIGVFFAFKSLADQLGKEKSTGIIWGLCGGITIMFIEMILYIIRMTRLEGFERERQKFLAKETLKNISGRPQPKRVTPGNVEINSGGRNAGD